MAAVSCISTMNVDWPRAMLSDAPTRAKIRSTIPSLASRAGTNEPACAIKRDERRLSQVRRLAAHVRARSTPPADSSSRRARCRWARTHPRRAARRPDDGRRRRPSRRRRACAASCSSGPTQSSRERREHVERRECAGRGLDLCRRPRDARAQRLEELHFALEDPLVGAEDLLLVLLERRRDEALAAGDRLLAVVVRRDVVQVRLRYLDVVAEDPVEPDLERRDTGTRSLARLPSRR